MEKQKESKIIKPKKKVDRKVLSFFLLLFPSLLISLTDSIGVKVALIFYQAILLKQFIEDYYTA